MVVIRGRLTPEAGAVLRQALAAAREALYQQARATDAAAIPGDVSAEAPSMAQQQADALAPLAETALHHGIDPGTPGERYQVVVHVDAAVLADPDAPGQSVLEGGTRVSAETSRRLACDASRVVMRHDADGRVVETGARTRTIPPVIRRALHHRDRGCRFPGCEFPFGQGHRRPASAGNPRRSRSGAPRAERGGGRAPAPRADGVPGLAGRTSRSGLGHRRFAPSGPSVRDGRLPPSVTVTVWFATRTETAGRSSPLDAGAPRDYP